MLQQLEIDLPGRQDSGLPMLFKASKGTGGQATASKQTCTTQKHDCAMPIARKSQSSFGRITQVLQYCNFRSWLCVRDCIKLAYHDCQRYQQIRVRMCDQWPEFHCPVGLSVDGSPCTWSCYNLGHSISGRRHPLESWQQKSCGCSCDIFQYSHRSDFQALQSTVTEHQASCCMSLAP